MRNSISNGCSPYRFSIGATKNQDLNRTQALIRKNDTNLSGFA